MDIMYVNSLNLYVCICGNIFYVHVLLLFTFSCCQWLWRRCCRERELRSRSITVGRVSTEKFPANVIRNQKYNVITFLPLVRKFNLNFLFYFSYFLCYVAGIISTIQVFPKFIFPRHGYKSIYTRY